MRLALTLGYASVRKMLSELTSKEVTEWIEYYRLEPFGPRHEDHRFALLGEGLSTALLNHIEHDEFIPKYKAETKPETPTPEESRAAHDDIVRRFIAMGAKVIPRKQ